LAAVDNGQFHATSFAGINGLTSSDIIVTYTYYGDADLSGDVTLDDFTQFLNGYQSQTPATNNWLNGDFDFSGTVTLDDFTQFLYGYQNQGAPLGALEAAIASADISSGERAMMLAAVEAVPEPVGVGSLGLLWAGFALSRRRAARPRACPTDAGVCAVLREDPDFVLPPRTPARTTCGHAVMREWCASRW